MCDKAFGFLYLPLLGSVLGAKGVDEVVVTAHGCEEIWDKLGGVEFERHIDKIVVFNWKEYTHQIWHRFALIYVDAATRHSRSASSNEFNRKHH